MSKTNTQQYTSKNKKHSSATKTIGPPVTSTDSDTELEGTEEYFKTGMQMFDHPQGCDVEMKNMVCYSLQIFTITHMYRNTF